MQRNMYAVITTERGRRTVEDYDVKSGSSKSFTSQTKEVRITYCESAEEAHDFLREIKSRKHPYVIDYRYGGLMHNVM